MGTYSAQLEIDAMPATLWPLIGNIERHPEWSMDEIAVSRISDDRFLSKVRAGARTLTAQIHVINALENELIEFRVRDETGTYMHRIGLAELEDATLVSRQVTPTQLSLGQRVLSTAARSPIRIPSLHGSLHRLAELAAVAQ